MNDYMYCEKCKEWVEYSEEDGEIFHSECGEYLTGYKTDCVVCSFCGENKPKEDCVYNKRSDEYCCEDCVNQKDIEDTVENAWRTSQGMKNSSHRIANLWNRR